MHNKLPGLFVFVGERPSDKARRMGVTWRHGRLAARQLFDALRHNGLDPKDHRFTNFFTHEGPLVERPGVRYHLIELARAGYTVVAMGQKVARELERLGIAHLQIVHPAARGRIRKKERYANHVREVLHG